MEYICAALCDRKGSLQAEAVLLWNTRRVHFGLKRCFSEGACIEYIRAAPCDRKGSLQTEGFTVEWRCLQIELENVRIGSP